MVPYAKREAQLQEARLEVQSFELKLDAVMKDLALLVDPLEDKKRLKTSMIALLGGKVIAVHAQYMQALKRVEALERDMGIAE